MSLLDDVSIVVTPNGYKAGTLYGVLPTATEGAELVVNGDFSSGTSPWALNPNWSLGGVGVIADGTSNSTIWQSGVVEDNKQYIVTYTLTDFLQGSINVDLSGGNGITRTVAGTYTEVITSGTSPTTRLSFEGGLSFKVTLSNISVKEWTASDMDVTRETAATRVDENGLVNYAEVLGDELITNGDFTQTPLGTGWTVIDDDADNYVVFDGSTARLKFLNTSPLTVLSSGLTLTAGKTYKLIVDVLTATSGGVKIEPGGGISETFDSAGLTTRILQPTANVSVSFYRATPNVDITFNSVSVKEVDLNNVPRIDYTGGGCPHILAEPQRTNTVTYSEDFSQWTVDGNASITSNAATSPAGTSNATKLKAGTSSGRQAIKLNNTTSGNIAAYVFAKKGEYSVIQLTDAILGSAFANFDLENGLVGSTNTYSANIENYGNGWYKCSITYNSVGAINAFRLSIAESTTSARLVNFSGNGSNGLFIWGVQAEAGSYPTSYIPTSGSTVTRNQDTFTRDGIGSLINDSEGVLFVEMAALADDLTRRRITLSDGTTNNRINLYFENVSNTIEAFIKGSGGNDTMVYSSSDTTQFHKIAVSYKDGDSSLWVNGAEVDTSLSTFNLSNLSDLDFSQAGGSETFYGKVKQLQVYKTALTDMQLIQLTGTAGTDFYESYSEMAETLTYTIQ